MPALLEEGAGLPLAVGHEASGLRRAAVELAGVVERFLQIGRHLDARDVVGAVRLLAVAFRDADRRPHIEAPQELGAERVAQEQVVDEADGAQLLEQRDVATSSLRRSPMASGETGTLDAPVALILITQISSGMFSAPTHLALIISLIGGLSENRPSQ